MSDGAFLYDFLTKSLLPFYGAPNLIEVANPPRCAVKSSVSRVVCAHSLIRSGSSMQDVIFVVVTIAFFVVSLGYVEFCDRIR